MKEKINIKAIPFRIIISIIIFLISISLFSIIAHEVVVENEDWFDTVVFTFFNGYSSPAIVKLFKLFTFFGSIYFLLPAYIILLSLLMFRHQKSKAIDVAVVSLTSSTILFVLKTIFARTRPSLPFFRELNTYSFPSGHALLSFVFFSQVTWILWKSNISGKWKWFFSIFFLFFSLAIGVSRIVLRYHYASDVLASISLGIAYVLFSYWILEILQKKI